MQGVQSSQRVPSQTVSFGELGKLQLTSRTVAELGDRRRLTTTVVFANLILARDLAMNPPGG